MKLNRSAAVGRRQPAAVVAERESFDAVQLSGEPRVAACFSFNQTEISVDVPPCDQFSVRRECNADHSAPARSDPMEQFAAVRIPEA